MAETCNAFCVNGALAASGTSAPFFLPLNRQVQLTSAATMGGGAGTIQMTLQACTGDPGQATGWQAVVSLASQNATGFLSAAASAPSALAGSVPMWRIAWTTTGSGGIVTATAVGVS